MAMCAVRPCYNAMRSFSVHCVPRYYYTLKCCTPRYCIVRHFTTSPVKLLPPIRSTAPSVLSLDKQKQVEWNVGKSKPYRDIWREKILANTANATTLFNGQKSNAKHRQETNTSTKYARSFNDISTRDLITIVEDLALEYYKGENIDQTKWKETYEALSCRVDTLSKEDLLFLLDCAYVSKYYSHRFIWLCTYCWSVKGSKALNLTRDDILHILFYAAMTKDIVPAFFTMCEEFICETMTEFSSLELSMMSTTFFSCNMSFRSYETVTRLAKFILSQKDADFTMDLVMATNFLKVFRHVKFQNTNFYDAFADLLLQRNQESFSNLYSLSPLANIAVAYYKMKVRHKKLFQAILQAAEKYARENEYRSKDLMRILTASASLRIPVPESFVDLLLEDLRTTKDAYVHSANPEEVENAVVSLGILGYAPMDLIDNVLANANIRPGINEDEENRAYIDAIAETLGDVYIGHRLDKKQTVRMREGFNPGNIERRDGFLEILQTLQRILGQDYVECESVLGASWLPDILLHLDENNSPLRTERVVCEWKEKVTLQKDQEKCIKDEFIKGGIPSSGTFETPSNFISLSPCRKSEGRRISIKVLSFNQYTTNTARMISGRHMLEIVLLNKLGYDVLVVWAMDAHRIPIMSQREREDYVHRHILAPLAVNIDNQMAGQKQYQTKDGSKVSKA